MRQEN